MTLQVEFQAVVLAAGKGSRMPEITAGKPRCLLPVGPKPLLWYPLYKLQLSGFTECIVIVLENQKLDIQAAIEKSDLNIKVEYQSIPNNEDLGTADALRLIHDKLHSNVLILPCDLITSTNLQNVINIFRKHNASIAALFLQPQSYEGLVIPGPKSKNKPERDFVGIDTQTDRLIFLASASDFENEISLPMALSRKHTHLKIFSTLLDSHVYILRNWVVKYLISKKNITTLKGEFLPHIIRKQLSSPPKQQEANPSLLKDHSSDDIFAISKENDLDLLIREMSSFNDHLGDSESTYHENSIRCFAHIADSNAFGIRVNTLPSYCLINKKIADVWHKIVPNVELVLQNPKADIKSTQVDNNCIIWEGAKLNEKTSFKNSVIGANVEVKSFSRVFNCIVMSNVTINERVALENCIISDNAIIGGQTTLHSCLVGTDYNVPDQSKHSNEVLTESDQLMEF